MLLTLSPYFSGLLNDPSMCEGFRMLWDLYAANYAEITEETEVIALRHPEFKTLMEEIPPEVLEVERNQGKEHLRRALEDGVWDGYLTHTCAQGAVYAQMGISYQGWYELTNAFHRILIPKIIALYQNDSPSLTKTLLAANTFLDLGMSAIGESYIATKEKLLRDAEWRLQQFVDSNIMGVFYWDEQGYVRDANQEFLRIVGRTKKELDMGLHWRSFFCDDSAVPEQHPLAKLPTNGSCKPVETIFCHKDGWEVPCMFGAARLQGAERVGAGFLLDISLQKRAQELEEQNNKIEEANRLKSEFLANMSHELRTPLTAIIGFSTLMFEEKVGALAPQHKEFMGDILESAQHLLRLINDILDLAKVEAGKMEFTPEIVELKTVVGQVRDILKEQTYAKKLQLSIEIENELPLLVIDPVRLKQVLYNFLSNAVKFTDPGGSVFVRGKGVNDEFFRLEVEDTGAGIPPEKLSLLFSEFQQLDASTNKRYGGTGLGLALTKRIVGAMGGRVGVQSAPQQGSIFYATLPLEIQSSENVLSYSGFSPMLHPSAHAPHALVVEDDPTDRRWLVNTLTEAGYAVQAASTGEEAIKLAQMQAFDIVTLDLLLPDMDGLQVLEDIRTHSLNPQVPVVIVSLVADQKIAAGFPVQDVLRKPVSRELLLRSLATTQAQASPKSILVVDDDPDALKLAKVNLESAGFACQINANPIHALQQATTAPPAAILLDLLMPGLDGFEFLSQLRLSPLGRRIPVIVWTSKQLSEQDRRRLSSQARSVVAKNFHSKDILLQEIEAALKGESVTV